MQHFGISTVLVCLLAAQCWPKVVPATQTEVGATAVDTSLCQALAHPTRFNGKRVQLNLIYSTTWEGAWLSEDQCDAFGQLVFPWGKFSNRYGFDDVVRDRNWEEFDAATRRLYSAISGQGQYSYITADFTGVLVIKRNFRVRHGFGNGWGHLGMSRFLLVLRTVSNVNPVETAPMVFTPQPVPDFLIRDYHHE